MKIFNRLLVFLGLLLMVTGLYGMFSMIIESSISKTVYGPFESWSMGVGPFFLGGFILIVQAVRVRKKQGD